MNGRLVAVGMSHHTANVDLRERMAIGEHAIPGALAELRSSGLGHEAVILSTCNRVELYTVAPPEADPDEVARWLMSRSGMSQRSADSAVYRMHSQEAVRHLFRVASSLDSMVVGEPQILAQVKNAYRLAVDHQATGPVMRRVMERALAVAKRVRTETAIARETVSVGRAGVELARQVLGRLDGKSALLIGAGAHGKIVARALLDYGLSELIVANRTFSRAAELARNYGGTATPLDSMGQWLERVDVVLTSTGAGRLLVTRGELAPIARKRRYRSLVMIDLSVPRNIDPDVNELGGVYRFDVDDLDQLAQTGKASRAAAARDAELIIAEEVERTWKQLQVEAVRQSIGEVVRNAETIRQAELARASRVLERMEPQDRKAIESMTRALVKKVLHQPLSQVRDHAQQVEAEALRHVLEALLPGDES